MVNKITKGPKGNAGLKQTAREKWGKTYLVEFIPAAVLFALIGLSALPSPAKLKVEPHRQKNSEENHNQNIKNIARR